MDSINLPESLLFVQDRITILRSARTILLEFNIDHAVVDLLEVSRWLAGDELPDPPAVYSPAAQETEADDVD